MKKRLLLVYVFVAFVLLCTNVYAVITTDLNIITDKESVKPGDELEVTVNLKNISTPVSSIQGYINVKESVLGDFSQDMLVAEDGKIEVKSGDKVNKLNYIFNPEKANADYDVIFNTNKENIENNDCFFVMDLKSDVSSSADILKFKFNIKEDATIETVKDALKVDSLVVYSDNESDKSEPVSATLDIKIEKEEEKPSDENKTEENKVDDDKNQNNGNTNNGNTGNVNDNKDNKNNTKNNTNTNKNTNTNRNTNTNKNTNKVANNTNTDGTVSGNKLPAAGAGMLIVPVIIFAILAYISYNRYIKYKDI